MEQIQGEATTLWEKISSVFQMDIYNGKSISDLLTLETLLGFAGNLLAAVLIIILGFVVAGHLRRKISKVARAHRNLDETLFDFFGNIVRYSVLAFTGLFVLNTFGVQTTSIIAVFGAAGLAIGLALLA